MRKTLLLAGTAALTTALFGYSVQLTSSPDVTATGKAVTEPLVTSGGQHVARGGNAASGDFKWLTSAMRMGPWIESMTNPNGGDLYGARLAIRIRAAE